MGVVKGDERYGAMGFGECWNVGQCKRRHVYDRIYQKFGVIFNLNNITNDKSLAHYSI